MKNCTRLENQKICRTRLQKIYLPSTHVPKQKRYFLILLLYFIQFEYNIGIQPIQWNQLCGHIERIRESSVYQLVRLNTKLIPKKLFILVKFWYSVYFLFWFQLRWTSKMYAWIFMSQFFIIMKRKKGIKVEFFLSYFQESNPRLNEQAFLYQSKIWYGLT